MARLRDVAKPYADLLGVDPYLVVGGPAEELDTIRRTDPIGDALSFVGNPFLDVRARNYFWGDHNAISQDLEDVRKVDQSRGVNAWKKLWHPVLADLGPGNIKLAHAIELLRRYNQRFPDSDPLQLKEKYNFDYKSLGHDLADWGNLDTTARFAVLDAADAVAFFQREAPRTWANADKFRKLGLVSTYYNRGREQMVRDAREERNLGGYDPNSRIWRRVVNRERPCAQCSYRSASPSAGDGALGRRSAGRPSAKYGWSCRSRYRSKHDEVDRRRCEGGSALRWLANTSVEPGRSGAICPTD
jgi:hypothetical protein